MRVLSQYILDNYDSGYNKVILININATNSIWISDKKINTISGVSNYILFSDILPTTFNEEEIKYISEINQKVQIGNNIFLQDLTTFDIFLIKKDSVEINSSLNGELVYIYLGIIDEFGNININDLLLLNTAHIKNVINISDKIVKINCIIGDVIINEVVPENFLTRKEYPNIPEKNIGKALPVLYGKFTLVDEMNEEYDPAPAIKVDDYENIYLVSNHSLPECDHQYFIYNSPLKKYVKIISDIELINGEKVYIRHDWIITCEAFFRLKKRGYLTTQGVVERYLYSISNKTILTLFSLESLFLGSDEVNDCGYIDYYLEGSSYGNIKLIVDLGNIINGINNIAAKVKYYLNGEMYFSSGNIITSNDSNTKKEFLLNIPEENFFKNLRTIQFGIVLEQNATLEFKSMSICIKFMRK